MNAASGRIIRRFAAAGVSALLCAATIATAGETAMSERQITNTPKNHCLDNNDNFSPDARFLCYDTRETIGPGIENCQSIEKVNIETGEETVLYKAEKSITGEKTAPGIGAASYLPNADRVVFIHGPLVEDVPVRGYYGKPNRNGAIVTGDGSLGLQWLDLRDVDASRDTLPGAHRGGTHRHEPCRNGGNRIGFTYDDFLCPEYDRNIGYMEFSPQAPKGALCYFAVLLAIPPMGSAKPGEIEKAYGDSWVDPRGHHRAFIGKVKEADGAYQESLFVVDIPQEVDIATADSGGPKRYPRPPQGLTVRRLTHAWAGGVVRGAPGGDRIAYYGHAADGTTQVYIIAADGSDESADPAKHPMQATHFPAGTDLTVRWHPEGHDIFVTSNGAIARVCVAPGECFGKTHWLTAQDGVPRVDLVVNPKGNLLAYTKPTPATGPDGKAVKNYKGLDFQQIYTISLK